ncbi:MAG TPA: TGS domain-containing protein, partial [Gammaproteobacteria bacterium]|nr:TGS domain-containing protein [Gammaproteobacteria bacterium]
HWVYKSDGKSDAATTIDKRARRWLRSLLELQRTAGDSLEFIENVKIDLYPDEIYVFTPSGEIMELPRGATAVDFAYAVHTDVGSACVAARINRRLSPLRSLLYNGQTVEIITAASAKPNPAWLNFVITAKARTNVRSYLKNLQKGEAADLGKRLLDQALQALSTSLADISDKQMQAVLREYQLEQAEQLFVDVGMGALVAQLVARTMAPIEAELEEDKRQQSQSQPLVIRGTEGMVVNYAKCCHPIPGDSILGFISKGRGIVIHRESCRNVADFSNTPDKWLEVEWQQELEGIFSAEIRVDVANQRGVLATLAALISDQDSNIENVNVEERDGMASTITFLLSVHNREHLARIMRQAKAVRNVIKISRTKS